jgi:alpha-tubulin suppressor-like RCC1 family protein
MIGVEDLIVKINTLIGSGSLTEDQVVRLSGAVNALENHGVSSVLTASDLPNPVTNKGRFIFIEREGRYVFSNGVSWDINSLIDVSGVNLYAFGRNLDGIFGDNTTTDRSSPVTAAGQLTDWIQVSIGNQHSLGIRANGIAWSWGTNSFGQMGDSTTINKSSPVSVVGGFTNWIQVSAGLSHSLGLRANGTAWGWGLNTYGQLGDGTSTSRVSPVSVVGGFTDWTQVSAGFRHSVGVRANGTAWSWGNGTSGILGDGQTFYRSSPVSVVGSFTDWVQVSAGERHSLGTRANGTAWGWGYNGFGRLGDNSSTARSSPVSVVGGFTDWVQLSAGVYHSIGLRANGTAWAWGANSNGQLGDGTTSVNTASPVSVVGGFTDWVQLEANVSGATIGAGFSQGIRANGTAWGWGNNTYGKLGDGTTIARSSPVSVIGGITNWILVSGNSTATMLLRG